VVRSKTLLHPVQPSEPEITSSKKPSLRSVDGSAEGYSQNHGYPWPYTFDV
jgi:hypothetical protein